MDKNVNNLTEDKKMGKPIKIEVTITCERCGKQKSTSQESSIKNKLVVDLGELFMNDEYAYNSINVEPLVYFPSQRGDLYTAPWEFKRNPEYAGKVCQDEILLCPDCMKKRGELLAVLVKEFNDKVRGFLENK